MNRDFVLAAVAVLASSTGFNAVWVNLEDNALDDRSRVIVTSDGQIDDECSMLRFL